MYIGNDFVLHESDESLIVYPCRFQGRTELRRPVPHSITSWILSAFSVNDVHGLGLMEEPRKVVTRPRVYSHKSLLVGERIATRRLKRRVCF